MDWKTHCLKTLTINYMLLKWYIQHNTNQNLCRCVCVCVCVCVCLLKMNVEIQRVKSSKDKPEEEQTRVLKLPDIMLYYKTTVKLCGIDTIG